MGIIKQEDIAGYRFIDSNNSWIVCCNCVNEEELKDLTEDEIIEQSEIENADEEMYFCDRCKKQLPT